MFSQKWERLDPLILLGSSGGTACYLVSAEEKLQDIQLSWEVYTVFLHILQSRIFSFVYISWSWNIACFASWLKEDFKLEEIEKLADHFIWDQFQNQVPCIQSWNILNLAFRENYNAYLSDQANVGRGVLWKHHIASKVIYHLSYNLWLLFKIMYFGSKSKWFI